MTRDEAVAFIKQELFFITGTAHDQNIIDRLKMAQRDLERGKTLPRFLLLEDQPITLLAGTHTAALPGGFMRVDEDNLPHYFIPESASPQYVELKRYSEALVANLRTTDRPRGPKVMVIRNTVLDFITTADQNYTLLWNYYFQDTILNTNIENTWLRMAPEWLWGEAGWRYAMTLGEADAVTKFDAIRKAGRAAWFGDDLLYEQQGGPFQMGEDN